MKALLPVVAGLALAAMALPLQAQTATVAVDEENFRAEPGGAIIAQLFEGTPLVLGGTRDRWREATLDAWIWNRSVGPYGELVMVNAGGENLRAAPNGGRLGRAEGGTQLQPVERRGNWLRVRRTAWIWNPSIHVDDSPSSAAPVSTQPSSSAPESRPEPAPPTPPSRSAPSARPASAPPRAFGSVAAESPLLDRPAGDSMAELRPGTTVQILETDGDWTRVRLEGWALTAALGNPGGAGQVFRDLSRDSLQARPDRYRGQLVEWTVQYISLQQAEAFRTDFLEGESFLLARGPGEDAGFVYVAVSPEQLDAVASLDPLQTLQILARIRSARSTLTGAPIVDLLEIR